MRVGAHLSLSVRGRGWGGGGRLFEAGHLLTFSAFWMGAYSRWVLINLVPRSPTFQCKTRVRSGSRLGANSRLGAYSSKGMNI